MFSSECHVYKKIIVSDLIYWRLIGGQRLFFSEVSIISLIFLKPFSSRFHIKTKNWTSVQYNLHVKIRPGSRFFRFLKPQIHHQIRDILLSLTLIGFNARTVDLTWRIRIFCMKGKLRIFSELFYIKKEIMVR